MDMKQKLQEIHEEAIQKIQQIDALDKLQEIRVSYLGKKGQLTSLLKGMKDVAKEEGQLWDRWSMRLSSKSRSFWTGQRRGWKR